MNDYGVINAGFNRKPLAVILAEIENQNITEFGPDVVQTSQSPLGQINGLMADLIAELWEFGEDVYQSYDIEQAEGVRLDMLGKLRLVRRAVSENDNEFRRAITNQGQARIDVQDIVRAITALDGVTYTQVFVNEGYEVDANGIPRGSIAVAVLGGDENEIANELRRFVVPGVSTYGNVVVTTNADGFCRSSFILRPILVPVKLEVFIKLRRDSMGCPPPSPNAVKETLVAELSGGLRRLLNGDDITAYRIRSVIESQFENAEFDYFVGTRNDIPQIRNQPVDIAFIELATLALADVIVQVV